MTAQRGTVRLPLDLMVRLGLVAERRGISLTRLVVEELSDFLDYVEENNL